MPKPSLNCPNCQSEVSVNTNFCPHCGKSLMFTCVQCNEALPFGARFCTNCGAAQPAPPPVVPPPPPAEQKRKQVTVLFADVSGFTAMSESLDAEEVTEVMNTLWAPLDAAITAHGGRIDKHIGDAVMALWGVDQAREDDPERAILAALAMQAELAAFRSAAGGRSGQLAMRIGLNTGPVLLGEVGSRHEFTAMGDTVNLASRLEHAAPVGGILIAHDTYRQVRGLFDFQSQPPLTVKGKSEPVQTYVVLRARPRSFHTGGRGVEGVQTPLVGRAAELSGLQKAFARLMISPGPAAASNTQSLLRSSQRLPGSTQNLLRSTSGLSSGTQNLLRGTQNLLKSAPSDHLLHSILVVGEAGVGKSRLLFEFESWLEAQPEEFIVLRGRTTPIQQYVAYSLLRDLFQERFKILESDSATDMRQKFEAGMIPHVAPEQLQLAGNLLGLGFEDASNVKNLAGSGSLVSGAFAGLLAYFYSLVAQAPVLIFLEDLHWADEASLSFIQKLAAELAGQRLLVVGLTRSTFFERCSDWADLPGWRRLNLLPLSDEHSRQLVDHILARLADPPPALRQLIIERAEGNPFYLEELVMMLIGDGVILCDAPGAETEAGWRVDLERLKTLHVPSTLVGVLQARLDNLPEAEKVILQRAAVIGRRFWDAPLAALAAGDANAPSAEALAELDTQVLHLSKQQLIFPQPRSAFADAHEYRFKHAILRDVAYETVLLKLRRLYHRLVAEWLEANCRERLDEYAGLIATHYERAGENGKAVQWLYRAGTAALDVSAFRDGLSLLQRALALLPEETSVQRARLLLKVGITFTRLGGMAEAARHLRQAIDMAAALQEWAIVSESQGHLTFVAFTIGEMDEARSLAYSCLETARKSGLPRSIASALMHIADFEDEETAQRHLEESLALFRQAGLPRKEATCLLNIGNFYYSLGKYSQSRASYEQSLEIFRQINDPWGIANDLANLGGVCMATGDLDAAIPLYEDAVQIESEIGDLESLCIALCDLGDIYSQRGQDEQALEYLYQALAEASVAQVMHIMLIVLVLLAEIAGRHGNPRRAAWLLGPAQEHPAFGDKTWAERGLPLLDQLRAALPEAELTAALEEGCALGVDGVVQECLTHLRLARQ